MTAPAISVKNLSFRYPDGVPALEGVSLRVAQGERVALLGANGAGKSTLMLHLNGLHESRGEVEILGVPVLRRNLKLVRQRVGLVFQNPDDQLFCPTVFEDVAFGPRNLGLPESRMEEVVTHALAQVGLPQAAQRSPLHLSIGEKKRAAMATVLAMEAEILCLDEPTAGLDPRGRRELMDLLKALSQTLLVVTHDLELARSLCSRCVIMARGKVVAEGETSDLLGRQELLLEHGLA
ncbi:ABC transporter ATP-binding protein [bacterium]|nr:MAG: ABC transporter ATP-binding protein [bacterium]RIK62245.1 MAG: cobalt ABC transporter ATP-binding protein [Planctomycetota bacterium]